jgi:IS66 C-terminal element
VRAAPFYTLIRTATLNGVEPEANLRDVIARIGAHPMNRLHDRGMSQPRRRTSSPPDPPTVKGTKA